MKHTDDIIDEGLEELYEDDDSYEFDESKRKSKNNSDNKPRKPNTTVIVNHGFFELKNGTGAKTNFQGDVVKVDPVKRLEYLKKGW